MFKSIKISQIKLLAAMLLLTAGVFAQATDNGSLEGTVYDPQVAAVPNATITVKNTATGTTRKASSDDQGRWKITTLPLGTYEVTAEVDGFDKAVSQAVVQAAQTNLVDLYLQVGGLGTEVVEVSTDDVSLISESTSGTNSSRFTGRAIEAAPQPARNSLAFTSRDSSTSADIASPLDNSTGNPETAVNGTRPGSSSFIFNGIDGTNLSGTGSLTGNAAPAPEAVEEVKLLSSNYDASLGRSGGGSFQLVIKEGGNDGYHGTGYFYFQNERFNANDFFFNRDGIDRQAAQRYEGGFTIGGPIIKDKLRFFASYQKTDAKTAYVPSASSFVVLPEALAFITDRSDPENVRQAFVQSVNNGGVGRAFRNGPSCIRSLTPASTPTTISLTCIDPSQVGFRLLSLINPATGDYIIPSLAAGRFERLYLDTRNVGVFIGGQRVTDFSSFGLPNGLPLLDGTFQGEISGGLPLVRFRNVFPAEFKQDQFSTRLDYNLLKGDDAGNNSNVLTGSFFFSDFPSLDPFSDSTLVSPFPLIKDDANRTIALKDVHIFSGNLINEARFGYFYLNNSRKLDERFLAPELTNEGQGIVNPAEAFVPGPQSQRLAHIVGAGNLTDFSVNAPNDIYNQRKQVTLTFANNVTYLMGDHTLRFGGEHKRNQFDTNLPEEQGIEFEGLINFTQLLTTQVPEADVALGISDKQFNFNDWGFYITDDWRVSDWLTLNVGVRWDLFGLPVEKNGRFTNFDFDRVADPNNILPGFILPSNSQPTGFNAIDASLDSIARADTKHTLNGLDYNNFAPRIGFAIKPFRNASTTIRGGYGIFFDRPSAGFINTVYSNFPFFTDREAANLFNPDTVQGSTAYQNVDPNRPFINNLPFSVGLASLLDTTPYLLRDNSLGINTSRGAEPLEFRAIDRDLKTPMVQQWNIGIQQEFLKDWTVEARYVGTKGQNLLLAIGFNQPYDLNDPNTPDYIYKRINDALTAVFPGALPALMPGQTERDRGTTTSNSSQRAFGACNPVYAGSAGHLPCVGVLGAGGVDLNLSSFDFEGPRAIISALVRTPYLGFDPTDAVILKSIGYSIYHSGQLTVTRRFSKGFTFNASYTLSKSIDIGSTDPGSTAASGRPDTANLGLVVQGNQRDLNSNRGLSDFDRPHRFVSSFTWDLPNFGSRSRFLNGWQLSGLGQWQSGTPFSIFATDSEFGDPVASGGAFLRQYLGIIALVTERNTPMGGVFREERYNVGVASGTIFNTAFGRPSIRSLDLLRQQGDDITQAYFNICMDPNDETCALVSPLGGFGNLGRNVLRGPSQKRFDISLSKSTKFFKEKMELELKWDIFNVFNLVNFANPNADLSDETDFGKITRTVGAPRVMQFGAKVRF
ncbi:MAG: TonB-dependent receptor [Aridibacter famidurans]|nr:TonB-dependent receptor [Aridibacter famidurans]